MVINMKGEKVFFRKKIFGGFNREDVVQYIAKIAQERNEAITAKEKAEKEVSRLTREIRLLRGEEPEATPESAPEPSLEPIPESAPEPSLEPILEPTSEPADNEPTEYEDTVDAIEAEKTEIIQPVDFGFVEETEAALSPDSGIAEETIIEASLKSKELADIDDDIAKIKEIGYIEEETKPARVKVIRKKRGADRRRQ
jgi:hypothetical protein